MLIRLAVAIFVVLGAETAVRTFGNSVSAYIISLGLITAAWVLRQRPEFIGFAMVAGGTYHRLALWRDGLGDQIIVAQAAGSRAMSGLNPWAYGYPDSIPPGAPYPYGPLGLFWWNPGVVVELVAVVALMGLLWWYRYWLALAVVAVWHPMASITTSGANDFSPALLIAVAMLMYRERRMVAGSVVLAAAAALKPYAFAWFLPAIGYAGISALLSLAAATLVLWSPLLLWGPWSFYESVQMAESMKHRGEGVNTLNWTALRPLAAPLALAALLVRRWETMMLAGSAVFLVVLWIGAQWASWTYWVAVVPPIGMAVESWLRESSPVRLDRLVWRKASRPSAAWVPGSAPVRPEIERPVGLLPGDAPKNSGRPPDQR